MRLSDPGGIELGPERHDQQHWKGRDPIDDQAEYFQARGVGPVHILDDHQDSSLTCERLELSEGGGMSDRFQVFEVLVKKRGRAHRRRLAWQLFSGLAVARSERQPLSHMPVTLGRKRFGPTM